MEATTDKCVTEIKEDIPDSNRTTADLAEEMEKVVLTSANEEIDALLKDESITSEMKDYLASHVTSDFIVFTNDQTPEYVKFIDGWHNYTFQFLLLKPDSLKEPMNLIFNLNCNKNWEGGFSKDDDGFLNFSLNVESPIFEPFKALIRSFLCNADGEELKRWDTECVFTPEQPKHLAFKTKISDYTTSGDSADSLCREDKEDVFVVKGFLVVDCTCDSSLGTQESTTEIQTSTRLAKDPNAEKDGSTRSTEDPNAENGTSVRSTEDPNTENETSARSREDPNAVIETSARLMEDPISVKDSTLLPEDSIQ